MSDSFSAIVATESDGRSSAKLSQITDADLPDRDVTVAVAYSDLNYKDGLAVTGKGKVVRRFPMICGCDLAGTIETTTATGWRPGDEVIVTGWGLSESEPGGYTRRQRVRSEWLVRKPDGLSLQQTMAVGTAGLTSMLSVLALEDTGIEPSRGEVLVTGAAGGVGSVAVSVLAQLGYQVAASTGRPETADYLLGLGATTIVDRASLEQASGRPLESERWAAAIDTVGGQTLATVIAQTRKRGAVAACGNAAGNNMSLSVFPFILRGVHLIGIESVNCPTPRRQQAWDRLATDLPLGALDAMTTVEPMTRVPELAEEILAGRTRGRVVIDVSQ
jgi:acrylyl-CoA reductase (NADPH)